MYSSIMKGQSMTSPERDQNRREQAEWNATSTNGELYKLSQESWESVYSETRQNSDRNRRSRPNADDGSPIRPTPHRRPKPSQVELRTRVPPGIELRTRVSPGIQQPRPRVSPGLQQPRTRVSPGLQQAAIQRSTTPQVLVLCSIVKHIVSTYYMR